MSGGEGAGRGLQRWALWILGLGILVIGALAVASRIGGGGDGGASNGVPAALGGGDVAFSDFVGPDVCAQCHQENYDEWRRSTHGRAGGEPAPDTIIAPFDGTPIRFADGRAVPTRTDGGRYVFVVHWRNEPPDTLRVDGVVGGGLMVGGGTQGYFTEMSDGTRRFIPFDWSATEERWFCNVRHPDPGEWMAFDEELRLAQCADWSPRRPLGSLEGFTNCQQCHGSQIQAAFDPEERRYATRYTTLRVNCESCHGAGGRHVELAESGAIAATGEIGLPALSLQDKDGSLNTCFRCHATKLDLKSGFLPGDSLQAHFSLFLPLLTDRTLFPDGRIRNFAYQLNHLASDCYLNGSMTCVSCHDPHTQTYRDEQFRPLEGRFDDGQCTSCHASKLADPTAHTYHEADSEGSACVSCHMPYLQHPSLGDEIRFARSDHTIPVPRPASDQAMGVPDACSLCHADEYPVEELQDTVDAWYGSLKPRKPLVQAMLDPLPRSREEGARALLRPRDDFPMAQYMALARFTLAYLTPDMDALDGATSQALIDLGEAENPDVRALALAAHQVARGNSSGVRELLYGALQSPDSAILVDRWTRSLSYLAEVYRFRGAPDQAVTVLTRALDVDPGNPELMRELGESFLAADRPADAVEWLRESVDRDPTRSRAWQSLGTALEAGGRGDEALEAFREAAERNPWDAAAHFRVGNAFLARGAFPDAEASFRRTLELDRSVGSARVGLAQILARRGDVRGAVAQLELALEFEPGNAQARQLLSRLR